MGCINICALCTDVGQGCVVRRIMNGDGGWIIEAGAAGQSKIKAGLRALLEKDLKGNQRKNNVSPFYEPRRIL